jgi:hypothetical protein
VIAQAPEVRQVVAEIDEIETGYAVAIYLSLVNELVPEQCRCDFRLTAPAKAAVDRLRSDRRWAVLNPAFAAAMAGTLI